MRARHPPNVGNRQGRALRLMIWMRLGSRGVSTHSSCRRNKKISQVDVDIFACLEEVKCTQIAWCKRHEEGTGLTSEKCSKGSNPYQPNDGPYDPLSHCIILLSKISPRVKGALWFHAVTLLLDPSIQWAFLTMDAIGRELWDRNCLGPWLEDDFSSIYLMW